MIINSILKRRSVRDYDKKEVPDELIEGIIKAAQFAPTARNNRLIQYIVIRDQETKNKLFDITKKRLSQEFIMKAPVILIMVSDKEQNELAIEDLSIASAHVFLQATELGLGTVWKNIWLDQAEEIKELLDIPEKYTLINIIPIGYPESEPNPHSDDEFVKEKIHREKW